MAHKDIREWIKLIEEDGELKRINGADWNLEMGGITEIIYQGGKRPVPALLYDDIPGYPKGYRTLFGSLASPRRCARALNLPVTNEALVVVENLVKKMRTLQLIPPKFVEAGPVLENQLVGEAVDLTKFPSPRHHELDGGRYFGTGHTVILKDPDTGWVNLGTYRVMLVDRNRLAFHALEGQHGTIIRNKYVSQGKVMPIAVATGIDPTIWWYSTDRAVPWGVSEYDYAGGMKGEAIEVIKGPYTGLPLPAHAEIVVEGELHPGEVVDEGPFGEWMGYYANLGLSPVPEPVMRVKAVYHRNDPIMTCANPAVPPSEYSFWACMMRSAMFWEGLERMGIPGITGVWCHEAGGSLLFTVVAIRQMYAGHSKRVGLVANNITSTIARYTIVVDEDIDPSDLNHVTWAIATRADPERAIQVLPLCGTTSADTTVSPEEKRKTTVTPKPLYSSRAVIDACQPFEWKNEWYPVARISSELRGQLVDKWEGLIKELC